jgi:hypothetical protein
MQTLASAAVSQVACSKHSAAPRPQEGPDGTAEPLAGSTQFSYDEPALPLRCPDILTEAQRSLFQYLQVNVTVHPPQRSLFINILSHRATLTKLWSWYRIVNEAYQSQYRIHQEVPCLFTVPEPIPPFFAVVVSRTTLMASSITRLGICLLLFRFSD